MEPFGYIYITTNLVDGKRYLGMCRYGKRKDSTYLGSGKLLKEAIATYGTENFTKEIIEICDSRKELSIKEMRYISEYDCVSSPDWYNIAHGGYSTRGFQGKVHSDETKAKMRKNYKRPVTDKVRKASQASIKNASPLAVAKNKERFEALGVGYRATQVEVDGITYSSIRAYAEAMGISQSSASSRIKFMKLGKRRLPKPFEVDGLNFKSVHGYAQHLGVGWKTAEKILDERGVDFRP